MLECFLLSIIFLAGAFFAIFISSKMYILAGIIAICGFILMVSIIKNLKPKNEEIIIKKLTYLYSLMDIISERENSTLAKAFKRVLRELALDSCGVGCLSTWIKYESENREALRKIMEGKNDNE